MAEELEQYLMSVGEKEDDEDNVLRTSLVSNPATQKLFAVFSKQEKNPNLDFKVVAPTPENEQIIAKGGFSRIISGVWFMPDTDYLRYDWETEAFFTTRMERSELKKAVTNFSKNGLVNDFNTHHDTDARPPEGLRTMEIWVLDDHKELSPILKNSIETLGYSAKDIPLGTVFMSVFVSNEQFFNDKILSGEVRGFSIEGFFKLSKQKKASMSKIKEMFSGLGVIQEAGVLSFADGKQLKFTKEGSVLDGDKSAANGDYKMKSGFQVVIRDGKVSDFGFEEVPAVAVEAQPVVVATPIVETPNVQTKTNEQIIEEKVAAILAKKEADKAALDAAKAAKDAELAAQTEALAAKQKEIDELKSKVKIPKTPVDVATYNKETHVLKKGILVPKR
jgi:hypothetical protein